MSSFNTSYDGRFHSVGAIPRQNCNNRQVGRRASQFGIKILPMICHRSASRRVPSLSCTSIDSFFQIFVRQHGFSASPWPGPSFWLSSVLESLFLQLAPALEIFLEIGMFSQSSLLCINFVGFQYSCYARGSRGNLSQVFQTSRQIPKI